MAINPTRHMHHDVTHWAVTGSNGFGGFTFAAPTAIKGRWEDRVELFRDPNGEEVVSEAIVYLPVDVDIGDYLAQGDHATIPAPVADPTADDAVHAYRVRQRHRTTNLANLTSLRKVYL